jgi:hypothetical protein
LKSCPFFQDDQLEYRSCCSAGSTSCPGQELAVCKIGTASRLTNPGPCPVPHVFTNGYALHVTALAHVSGQMQPTGSYYLPNSALMIPNPWYFS